MMDGDGGGSRFACVWCGLAVVAPGDAAGRGKCPHCGAVLDATPAAPEPYALAEAPAPPARSSPWRPAPPPVSPNRGFWGGLFHESARRESVLAAEIVALVALSVADLMTTYHLLRTHPKFYESNPVAQFVFARWNIAGMAVFKLSVVAFVVTVAEVAERKRPGLGKLVLFVGCLATGAVVFHGLRLAFGELAE